MLFPILFCAIQQILAVSENESTYPLVNREVKNLLNKHWETTKRCIKSIKHLQLQNKMLENIYAKLDTLTQNDSLTTLEKFYNKEIFIHLEKLLQNLFKCEGDKVILHDLIFIMRNVDFVFNILFQIKKLTKYSSKFGMLHPYMREKKYKKV
ncbi:hypothetical protein EDEG_03909 [Edhazardia aedis USNM 41457]|uniref:Uncharacterized protein n=1 Tax=Edhazardia aedis (strain USNM 41457) TaxID=1003232 RepID=J9D1P9_EDHAE|nr:hypothetical protein EDEG_03909 [Edhazardia aedis USNM 41457]|eukprot:EJW01504.1 hypothetical protein EDEG_03909 [Edhazardia aedis USNM 41457]